MATQLPTNPDKPIFTAQTAADYLGMTERQVYDAARKRRITFVRVGQYLRFRQTDLDEYLERMTVHADD